jgi:hypothetical protein
MAADGLPLPLPPSSSSQAAPSQARRGATRGAPDEGPHVGERRVGEPKVPPRLDTPEGNALLRRPGGREGDPKGPPGEARPPSRQVKRYAKRQRLARPSRKSFIPWMDAYGSALDAIGWGHAAAGARMCGRQVFSQDCYDCGERNASVRLSIHCDLRACPLCQRRHAADRQRTMYGAALRVSGYVATRAAGVIADLGAAVEAARAAVDLWTGRSERAEKRGDEALATRHYGRASAAEDRRRAARWQLERAREHRSWRWSMVTISPPWRPLDPLELTVEGLRRRIADVWERWDRLWSTCLSAGGLAAASARLEISAHGHVHIHAVVFAGYVRNAKLRAVAGCHIDRRVPKVQAGENAREVLENFLREAVKYALKAPSSTRYGFMSGDASRSGASMHPELAARVTVALSRSQTIVHYGVMRAAVSAEIAAQGEGDPVDDLERQRSPRCPCCGSREGLGPVEIRHMVDVARDIGADGWRSGWRGRDPPSVGGSKGLPPRIAMSWRTG